MKKAPIGVGAGIRFTYLGHSGFMMISPKGKSFLTGTPEAFQELMKEVPGTTVILLKPGESSL